MLPLRVRVDLGAHSLKLQHYWNLTIRLFNVLSRTPIGGVLPLSRYVVSVFGSPSRLSQILAECGLVLSWRSTMFLLLTSVGHFLRFSCTHCWSWEYKSALTAWLWLKNWERIILQRYHYTHYTTSMKFHLWDRL